MAERLNVLKTWKLYIGGAFPRTESGRTEVVKDTDGELLAHICPASRKDLRNAVEAATKASGGWAKRTAYNRGQILYRMAEMVEGRRAEFVDAIRSTTGDTAATARREVDASIDRLVSFAGWTDKFTSLLGSHNPVAGPYYTFTVPDPTGVVAVVPPDEPSLLGIVTLLAPPLAAGNAVIAVAGVRHPIAALLLGEVCATSDVPGGVVNILTARRRELLEPLATHRGIDAISTANLRKPDRTTLDLGTAENMKRVHHEKIATDAWHDDARTAPWTIAPFVEMKTIWHPSR